MKKTLSRVLATVAVAALALSTAACGQGASKNSPNDGSSGETIVPREISWLLSRPADGGVMSAMKTIAEEYAADHPGFKLNLISTPDRPSYIQKYETLAAANKLPELFDTDATPFAKKLADQGRMVDVEALLKDLNMYDSFRPAALTYQRFDDGSLYMIPFEFGAEFFWYNKDIFNKAGIDVPKSLDDFPAMCKALSASGVTPIALDGQDQWPLERYMAYHPFRTAGSDYVMKLKKGEAKLSDPDGKAAVEWMYNLGQSGCFQEGFSSVGYSDAQALFTSGKAAIYNMGTWELPSLATDKLDPSVRDSIDYFTLPLVDNAKTTADEYVAPSGIGMAINAATYDPLVKDFITYALKRYSEVYSSTGSIAPTTNVQPKIPEDATPLYQRAIDDTNKAGENSAMPWDTQLDATSNTRLQQELTLLVQGDTTPDQFIATMDTVISENGPKAFA